MQATEKKKVTIQELRAAIRTILDYQDANPTLAGLGKGFFLAFDTAIFEPHERDLCQCGKVHTGEETTLMQASLCSGMFMRETIKRQFQEERRLLASLIPYMGLGILEVKKPVNTPEGEPVSR